MVRRPEQPRRDRRLQSRREKERQKQRLIITVGVVIVVLALAIPAFGYYISFIRPPRTVAAKVGNTTYTMGDLVKKLRVLQAQGVFAQNPQAIASAPMETLYNTVQDELIRQSALKMGITVTRFEVDQVVQGNFYPTVPEGQQVEPAQLQKEFEENYRRFLTRTTLSRKEFEQSIEYALFKGKLREQLGKQVPSVADQVEVYWIRTEDSPSAVALQERFKKGESFAAVAQSANTEAAYANKEGYVGWVPKGAFRELDSALFSIEHNKISDLITTTNGVYIVKVTAGPEAREVSPVMKEALKDTALNDWVQNEWAQASQENRLRISGFGGEGFGSVEYAWLIKQLRLSTPPATPTPATR